MKCPDYGGRGVLLKVGAGDGYSLKIQVVKASIAFRTNFFSAV
jgi:hypothetical protein